MKESTTPILLNEIRLVPRPAAKRRGFEGSIRRGFEGKGGGRRERERGKRGEWGRERGEGGRKRKINQETKRDTSHFGPHLIQRASETSVERGREEERKRGREEERKREREKERKREREKERDRGQC